MNSIIRFVYEQTVTVLKQLNIAQRITITLLAIVLFISLVAVGFWGSRPDYDILYSGLSQQDAGEVVQKLSERNISYKIGSRGDTILISSKKIREVRLQLATEGLPKSTGLGYELFDNFKLGTTEFTQKVNYQRALENELAKTIAGLDQIRSARIHIVMPEESLFIDEGEGAKASIVLDMLGNSKLNSSQISGLVHLVASAVKGLSPNDVTIVDTNGNVLYSYHEDEEGINPELSMKQLEVQRKYERMLQNRIASMLSKVFGPNSSVVRVNVVMNFDKNETDSETFIPAEDPIVRSQRALEESFKGNQPPANINLPAGDASGKQNSDYTKVDETFNYEVSKRVQRHVTSPGAIKQLSIAVILDRRVSKNQEESLLLTISSAAGINVDRGDIVTLSTFPFDKTLIETDKVEMKKTERNNMIIKIVRNVGLGLLVLITLFFVRRTLKRLSTVTAAQGNWNVDLKAGESEEVPAVEIEEVEKKLSPEEQKKYRKDALIDMLNNDPKVFSNLLRRWLDED